MRETERQLLLLGCGVGTAMMASWMIDGPHFDGGPPPTWFDLIFHNIYVGSAGIALIAGCSFLLLFRWLNEATIPDRRSMSEVQEQNENEVVYDPARQFVNQVYRPEKANVILNSPLQVLPLPSDSRPDVQQLTWNLIWKDSVLSALLFIIVGFIMASILKSFGVGTGVRQYLTPCTGAAWALFAVCLRWIPRRSK